MWPPLPLPAPPKTQTHMQIFMHSCTHIPYTVFRKKMVEVLREKFASFGLTYSVGGQISFDVFPNVRVCVCVACVCE